VTEHHPTNNPPKVEDMVDIAGELERDIHGIAAKEMIARFETDAVRLEEELRGALPPEQFKSNEMMCKALRTAQEVIKNVWVHYHPGKELVI
jgi:hypothetical protein